MPKLKVSNDELDERELEEAEWQEGGDFETYDGEQPPKGTILGGYVKSLWWTYTKNDDPMLKILWVAAENVGDLEEYNGLPLWENAALTAAAKFKWAPFLNLFGVSIGDVKKKTVIEADDDQFGAPIVSIAGWEPGEESEAAWCRVLTGREKYQGEWQTRIGRWLKWEEPEAADADEPDEPDDEPDEPEDKPARGGRRRTATADEEPTKPRATRGSGRSAPASRAKAAPTRGRRSSKGDDEPPF